jgi:hypothetical protein
MSVVEYVDFLETRSLHMGVDVFTLNMEYLFEKRAISNRMYEMAKGEILSRHTVWLDSDDDYNYYTA